MKTNSLTCLLTLFLSVTAHTQSSTEQFTNDGWETLKEQNYSINYPDTWELDTSGQMGMSFLLLSPTESDQDQFRENVNLMVQDLTGHNLDLDAYTELSVSQINTLFVDGTLLESKRMGSESIDYHKVLYTGKQGAFTLKFEQYYWVIDNMAYILTLTCEESAFDDYQKLGETILSSFVLDFN